jgi:hypothetical protein
MLSASKEVPHVTESGPIRVFPRDGKWIVDFGSHVCAYCATRSQAVAVGSDAALAEQRELLVEIDHSPLARFVEMGSPAFSEYINGRLAATTKQALTYFLERFDPVTATDADLARRTLLIQLARAEHDHHVPLTEHEDAQLDRLISAQPAETQDMYSEVRETNARHVLYLLRGLKLPTAAGPDPRPFRPFIGRGTRGRKT